MRVCSLLLLSCLIQACGTDDDAAAQTSGAPADDATNGASTVLEEVRTAAATITAEDFDRQVGIIAHDSMRGRATPSPELDATAEWLAEQLESMGVRGGVDGGYVQWYQLEVQGTEGPMAIDAPNVVGVIEGSDPDLRDEYVVFSAHMDHVGVGRPDVNGDSIYNGADDDASGTVAVLEIAQAVANLPTAPRRSMLFLWVSGEERGLWGSAYFASNPTVPVDAMVANLNMDMVGRNWTDTIVAIGKEHSDLGTSLHAVAAAHPELNMAPVDDLWPAESFYTRSDHYNFARQGVPVLFFFNGTHEDYHQPSDEPDLIDSEKASRIAQLVFYLGVEVANRDERPEWDPDSYRQIVEGGR